MPNAHEPLDLNVLQVHDLRTGLTFFSEILHFNHQDRELVIGSSMLALPPTATLYDIDSTGALICIV